MSHCTFFYIAVLTLAFIILVVPLPAVVFWSRSTVDITHTTITQWHPQKPNFFLLDCCRRHEYISPNTFSAKTLLCGYVIHLTSEALSCIVSPDMCLFLFDASFEIIKSRKIKSLFMLEDLSKWMQATIPVTVWRGKLNALRVSFNIHEKSNVCELF